MITILGQPLVDSIYSVAEVPENEKGNQHLVDADRMREITTGLHLEAEKTGGCAGNAAKLLSRLGTQVLFAGRVGNDERGAFLRSEFTKWGIQTDFERSTLPTGHCSSLVTPDHERTLYTSLGAGSEPFHVNPEWKEHLHIEGFLTAVGTVVEEAIENAQGSISYDLAAEGFVHFKKRAIWDVLKSGKVSLLFGNRSEYSALTGEPPQKAIKSVAAHVATVVCTLGAEGSLIRSGNKTLKYAASSVDEVVDTTGAGDAFTGAFLHGFVNGFSQDECAKFASLAGAGVVTVWGADVPEETVRSIKQVAELKAQPLLNRDSSGDF